MKISKLFHWLYAILMLLPFGLLVFNALASMWSGNTVNIDTWNNWLSDFLVGGDMFGNGVCVSIYDTYSYLIFEVFGFEVSVQGSGIIIILLTYWTCISIIWLVFDVFMYVPLLVHRWIDKAKIE